MNSSYLSTSSLGRGRSRGIGNNEEESLAVTSKAAIALNNGDGGASAVSSSSASSGATKATAAPPGMASPPNAASSPRAASNNNAKVKADGQAEPPAGAVSPTSARSPRHSKMMAIVEPTTVTVESLKARREAIISMLHTIRATLFKNNELVGETQGIPDKTEPYDLHWLTYRPKNADYDVLTYRGKEKALDLLRRFDRDHDDMLDFSDFRGYLEHFQRSDEFGYLLNSRESWLSYVDDMFETDKHGKLTAQGFLMHRQEVERRHPLSQDLESMGMNPLTTKARLFRNAGMAFDRLDVESQRGSMDRLLRRGGAAGVKPSGKIPIQQLQLLLGDCGESLSVQRGKELMLYHNDHQRLMASLLARFARKDFGRKRPPMEELDDPDNVYKLGFWSWFMSGRPTQETRWLERRLISFKNAIKRTVRNTTKGCEFVWKHAVNGIRRGVITPQVFLPHRQETARYEAAVKIGRCDNLSGGMMFTARFQQLDSERTARKKTGMPTSAGMGFTLDLLLKPDATPQQVVAVVAGLKRVIAEHLESEITKLPRFLSWQVFPAVSDLDSLKVLRVAIYLKTDMHVDNILKQLQLGFALRDLMSDFSIEARTNVDMRNVCDQKTYVLDDEFSMRVDIKSNLCRGLVSTLLKEVFTCMHDVHQERKDSEDFNYGAEKQAKDRTLEAYPQQTTRFLRETFKYHHPKRPAIEETIGELEASEVHDPEGEALLDFPLYETWGRRILVVQQYLQMIKAATWDICFNSIGEALFGTAFARALLPQWFSEDLVRQAGALADASRKLRLAIFHEVERVRKNVEEHDKRAEQRAQQEHADCGEEGLRRKRLEKEKADVMRRLQALSAKTSGAATRKNQDDEEDEDDDKSRLGVVRKMRDKNLKTQKAVMECYRALASSVVGPHSVHVTSGRYRLYLQCEGVDVWDTLIPAPREQRPDKAGKKRAKRATNQSAVAIGES